MKSNRTDKWYINGKLRPHFAGKLRGYPGLKNTAKGIMKYVPHCKIYVEPFAGLGRTTEYVSADKIILNDMSDYAVNYLKNKFPKNTLDYRDIEITQEDFKECILKHDSEDTFFLIDPPWSKSIYTKNIDDNTDVKGIKIKPFCNITPSEYYRIIFDIIKTIKGKWLICMNHNRAYPKEYKSTVIESTKTIMGYAIKTRIVYND